MQIRFAPILVSILFAACGGDSPTGSRGIDLQIETVTQSSYSGFATAQRKAIRSEADWARIWLELNGSLRPTPPRPVVDFSRETLLLAAAGTRSNGCYSIDITRAVSRSDGSVELEVTETVPGASCGCTQAQTRPVHVVRIDHRSSTEAFTERQQRQRC